MTDDLSNASPGTVIAYPYTGDYRIDVLLDGDGRGGSGLAALTERWNAGGSLGSPVNVTYSFMTVAPWYGGTNDGDGDTGFSPFTDAQKAAVRTIFAHLQAELGGITFTAVSDSSMN